MKTDTKEPLLIKHSNPNNRVSHQLSLPHVLFETIESYSKPDSVTLTGHGASVNSVSISPNSRILASASLDSTVNVWDLTNYSLAVTLTGHKDEVWTVKFSHCGKILASGSKDSKILLWDFQSFPHISLLSTLSSHSKGIQSLTFTSDDKHLISCSDDLSIQVFNMQSKSLEFTLIGHKNPIKSVSVAKNSSLIISSSDKTIKVWDFSDQNEVFSIKSSHGDVNIVALVKEDEEIITATDQGFVVFWNLLTRTEEFVFQAHCEAIYSLAVSHDGKSFVTGSADLVVKVFDMEKRIEKFRLAGHTDAIDSVDISFNSKFIVVGMANSEILVKSIENVPEVATLSVGLESVTSMQLTSDFEYLITGSADSCIKVFNLNTMQEEARLGGHTDSITKLLISKDNKWLFSASLDGLVKVWNFEERNEEKIIEDDIDSIYDMALSSSNKVLANLGTREISVWSVDTLDRIRSLKGSFEATSKLEFSNDNRSVLVTVKSEIQAWSLASGNQVFSLKRDSSLITGLALTPDNLAISTDSSSEIKAWNLTTRKLEFSLQGHESLITSSALCKSGKYLATSSCDNSIQLWNLQTRQEVFNLSQVASSITSLKHIESSNSLIAGTDSGLVLFFDLKDKPEDFALTHGTGEVLAVDLSPNNEICASASSDGSVSLWNLQDKQLEHTFNESSPVKQVKFSPNGKNLIGFCSEGTVKIWEVESKAETLSIDSAGDSGHAMFSPNDLLFAFTYAKTSIKVCTLRSFDEVLVVNCKTQVFSFDFTKDCKFLLAPGPGFKILAWDLAKGSAGFELSGHGSCLKAIKVSNSGELAVSSGNDKFIKVWNLDSTREVFSLFTSGVTNCLGFSTSDKFVISAGSDGFVDIWNLYERRREFRVKACRASAVSAAFAQNGNYFVTAGSYPFVKFWTLKESVEGLENCKFMSDNDYYELKYTSFGSFKVSSHKKEIKSSLVSIRKLGNDQIVLAVKDEICKFNTGNRPYFVFYALQELIRLAGTYKVGEILEKSNLNSEILGPASIRDSFFVPKKVFMKFLACMNKKEFGGIDREVMKYNFSPFLYSIVHFWAGLGRSDLINQHLVNNCEGELRTDVFGRSPIYYSIHCKYNDCTESLLKFIIFQDNHSNYKLSTIYSIRNDFKDIVENSSSALPEFLNKIFLSTERFSTSQLDLLPSYHFSQDSIPNVSEYSSCINNEIVSASIKFLPFKLPSDQFSSNTISLLESISKSSNKRIFETSLIKFLIDYNWSEIYSFALFYAGLILFNLISFLVLLSTDFSNYLCPIIYFSSSLSLFLWELLQLSTHGAYTYFTDVWNISDFLTFFLSTYWLSAKIFSINTEYELFILTFLILLKGLSAFRLFDGTRYYINLIISSLLSIRYFLIMFIYSTFSFSVLLIVSNHKTFSFNSLFDDTWGLNFGESADDSDSDSNSNYWLNYICMFLVYVVNIILMLNMLISILGDSFDQFQVDKSFIDYKEKIEICIEIQKTLFWKRTSGRFGYFNAFFQCSDQGDGNWESRIDFVERKQELRIESLRREVKGGAEGVQKEFQVKFDEMKWKMDGIENNVSGLHERIEGLEDGIKKVLELLDKKK